MNKLKLSGKQLRAIGYPEAPVISIAMNVMEKNYKHHSEQDALKILKSIFENPEEYLDDVLLVKIAEQLVGKPIIETEEILLNETGIHYNIFGAENIEEGALKQMEIAAKLPVAVAGALMPDAPQAYKDIHEVMQSQKQLVDVLGLFYPKIVKMDK